MMTSNFAAATIVLVALSGCLGKGGAVSVRWRISEQKTGALYDPRDVSDDNGTCCQPMGDQPCSGSPAWRVNRVRVVLADSNTGAEVMTDREGLDAGCGSRELTTPFSLPEGLFAISLRAYDPAMPDAIEAESPAPAIRTVRKAEIVNLDVVELEVSTTP
jgi:hypothetical protein